MKSEKIESAIAGVLLLIIIGLFGKYYDYYDTTPLAPIPAAISQIDSSLK